MFLTFHEYKRQRRCLGRINYVFYCRKTSLDFVQYQTHFVFDIHLFIGFKITPNTSIFNTSRILLLTLNTNSLFSSLLWLRIDLFFWSVDLKNMITNSIRFIYLFVHLMFYWNVIFFIERSLRLVFCFESIYMTKTYLKFKVQGSKFVFCIYQLIYILIYQICIQ